jgi:hypothetical protein
VPVGVVVMAVASGSMAYTWLFFLLFFELQFEELDD